MHEIQDSNEHINRSRPDPGRKEKIYLIKSTFHTEKKKLIFVFTLSFGAAKSFYEGLHKSFEAPPRSVKIKI